MIARLRAVPEATLYLVLMQLLTFSTGVVDAVGYLGLDRVFTGNMTGNVVVLGMGLAGGNGLPVLGPALALGGFMAGAAISGRVLRQTVSGWPRSTTVLLGVLGAGVLVLAGVLFAMGSHPSHRLEVTVTTLLGVAMGMQAAAARVVAVKDVTTVVVTSTITGLAADSRLGSGRGGSASTRRALAVVLILAGATCGALLLRWQLGAGLVLAGVVIVGVAAAGTLRRPPP